MSQAHTGTAAGREPFMRLARRVDPLPRKKALAIRAIAILGALVTGGLIILLLGHNPFSVYADMASGALGTPTGAKETIRTAIPLLLTAVAIAPAFKMKFWNIGAEGQILVGAIGCTYFALYWYDRLPRPVLLLVMFLAAAVLGALWCLIPAFFKAKWGTNETLFTLMLNYIALGFEKYLQNGPWKDPVSGFPQIPMIDRAARLPKLFGVHIGWMIALLFVIFMYFYMRRSKQGYEIAVVGESVGTARYAGMNVFGVTCRTALLSGAIAGIVGFLQVSGASYTLTESTAGGVGFTAITVAWLSGLNPFIMIVVSFFLAILSKGSNRIQTTFKIPASASSVITGIILFFMLGSEFFINYRLIFRDAKGGARNG